MCLAPDAPLDKGNPMASNIQPYAQPSNHAAHVDSAGTRLEPANLVFLGISHIAFDDTPFYQTWHTLRRRHTSKSQEVFNCSTPFVCTKSAVVLTSSCPDQ